MTSGIPYYSKVNFTNLTVIGVGGGGWVYKGEQEDFGQIALKEFICSKAQPHEKYRKEIEILIKHRHPNIVNIYGILWDGVDKSAYLGYVMEYVKGGSLHDVIFDSTKVYGIPEICCWIEQISLGLQFLHKNGIIHRDIKPGNILLAGETPKLADFGSARDLDVSITVGVGTPVFMAPEVIMTGKYGFEADIYSLAIVVWELFHRMRPYFELGDAWPDILYKISCGMRPAISSNEMNESCSLFIERCWHEKVSERPPIREIIEYFKSKQGPVVPRDIRRPFIESVTPNRGMKTTVMILKPEMGEKGDIAILNANRSKWIEIAVELPPDIQEAAVVHLDEQIYIIGGDYDRSKLRRLSTDYEWEDLAEMHVGRSGIGKSCLELNGFIWVCGGLDGKDVEGLRSMERYDPGENKWFKMADMKNRRREPTAAVCNGKIYICGGFYSDSTVNFECFDPESEVWTELVELPELPRCCSLLSYGNRLVALIDGQQAMETNPPELNGKWKPFPSWKYSGWYHTIKVLGEEIIAIGGAHDEKTNSGRIEIFNGKEWIDGPSLPLNWHAPFAIVCSCRSVAHLQNKI